MGLHADDPYFSICRGSHLYSTGEGGFARLADDYSTGSSLIPQRIILTAWRKMRAALDPFMLAMDVADYLVRKGVPFRETHHISGRVVALSEQTGTPMNELTCAQLKTIDARFEEDISEAFDYEKSAEMRSPLGGTAKSSVLE